MDEVLEGPQMKIPKIFTVLLTLLFANTFAQEVYKGYSKIFPEIQPEYNDMALLEMDKTTNTAGDSNTTLIGRWPNGPCYTAFVNGNYAYISSWSAIQILEISNPAAPVASGIYIYRIQAGQFMKVKKMILMK